jgi:RNA polymerase sigma-70 factor (ECF subfamily)
MSTVATWPVFGAGFSSRPARERAGSVTRQTVATPIPPREAHKAAHPDRYALGEADGPLPGTRDSAGRERAGARPVSPRAAASSEPQWGAIVGRCVQGDGAAWAELVRSQHRRVYSMCYRFTGSAQDAEDLTQDVFLKLYGSLHSFDGSKGSFPTWIATVTRNLLVDHFRRTRMERATGSMDAGWDSDEEMPTAAERLQDRRRSPHDHTFAREIGEMVQAALARVSPELREAVILRDLEDMDYKDIAQVLRVPEGTVKSRISRGRAELARLLERNRGQVM